MTQVILQNQLTTKAKVKSLVGITNTAQDDVIDMLINNVSLFVEGYCGNRKFLSQTYTNEIYDSDRNVGSKGGTCLFLHQFPITAFTTLEYRSGTITSPVWITYNTNSYITYLKQGFLRLYGILPEISQGLRVTYTAGYLINWANEGVLSNSTITYTGDTGSFTAGDTITDSTTGATATYVSNIAGTVTVTNVSGSFNNGDSLSASHGWAATCGTLTLNNLPLHTLPYDLTFAVTEIVARKLQLRQSQGIKTQNVEGMSVSVSDDMTKDQLAVLKRYAAPRMAI